MENKNGYLFVDDILDTGTEVISKELLEKYPIPQRGKIIIGTFNIKDFERVSGRLKDV